MRVHRFALPALAAVALGAALALAPPARATDPLVELRFAAHRFTPQKLAVAAGRAFTIRVVNASTETIEFESFALNRETVIQPGQSVAVHLPGLTRGSYDFYDDFHQDVPQGAIVAQ
jgi:uncharacterized protein (DUF58 family)